MLSAAYAILGLHMKDGNIEVGEGLFEPKGDLQVRSLSVKGLVWRPDLRGPVTKRELETVD